MVYRASIAILLAAAAGGIPAAVAQGCGDLIWPCCDIPDNNPNAGTCKDDTKLTCWEGFCKKCGTDGMPACAGHEPCEGKLIVMNGFCTFDNSVKPSPMPGPKPAPKPAPKSGPLKCGDLKWECCDIPDNNPNAGTCRDPTKMTCWEGFCKRCGTDGMPICAGDKPCTGKLIVKDNFCTFDNSMIPKPTPSPKPTAKPSTRMRTRTRTKPPRMRSGMRRARGTKKTKTTTPTPAPTPVPTDNRGFAKCGDLKWECCDIPDNNPNAGTCRDSTKMTCWEGVCKRCGTDGMPTCAGDTPCTGKLIVKNDFCTFNSISFMP